MNIYTAEGLAKTWTDSYNSEASQATDEWGNTVINVSPSAMQASLETAFSDYSEDVRDRIESALNAYWSPASLTFLIVPPDGIPGSGISNVITNSISGFSFDTGWESAVPPAASKVAEALVDATKSLTTRITYLIPGSPPTQKTADSTLR